MSKIVRTPIVVATTENIASAIPLEPLYDKKNNDLIIKNKDGNTSTSLYKSFKEKLIKDGYMSSKYLGDAKNKKIYGFTIDLNENDPSDSVSYIHDCSDFAPMSFNSDGSCNYGVWYNIIKNYFGIAPCLVKPSGSVKELMDTNYSKSADGLADFDIESGDSGDVFIRFTKKYYKIEVCDDTFTFKVANYKVDDSYICDAFLDKDGIESDVMYIAAYRSCIQNNEIRSLSNKQPAPFYNISDVRNNITSRKGDYIGFNISRYIYLQCLLWLFTKNCNTKSLLEYSGKTKEYTGYLNKIGLFYSSPTGYKLFGIENFMANNTFIEGILIKDNQIKYKLAGNYDKLIQYKTAINNDVLDTGYISKITIYDGRLVLPLVNKGSSSGIFGIKYNNNITDSITPLVMTMNNIRLGGYNSAYSLLTFCKEV